MSRVSRSPARNARRKKIFKLAKGYRGRNKNCRVMGWRFQRLRVRFQSRLSGRSQMSFLGSARFMCVS